MTWCLEVATRRRQRHIVARAGPVFCASGTADQRDLQLGINGTGLTDPTPSGRTTFKWETHRLRTLECRYTLQICGGSQHKLGQPTCGRATVSTHRLAKQTFYADRRSCMVAWVLILLPKANATRRNATQPQYSISGGGRCESCRSLPLTLEV